MNQLRVLDRPAKCLLLRRARLKRQAHYIVVVCIALDQNGPKQNGLEQLLQPRVPMKMWPWVVQHYCCTRCLEAALVRTDHQLQTLYLEGPAQYWLRP